LAIGFIKNFEISSLIAKYMTTKALRVAVSETVKRANKSCAWIVKLMLVTILMMI